MIQNQNPKETNFELSIENLLQGDYYQEQLKGLLEEDLNVKYFTVKLMDLQKQGKEHHSAVIQYPLHFIKQLYNRIKLELSQFCDKQSLFLTEQNFHVNFTGPLGVNCVSPRGLNSFNLNQLVKVEGVVTHISQKQVQLQKSVQYSELQKKFVHTNFQSEFQFIKDNNKREFFQVSGNQFSNPLSFEAGLCVYKDVQIIGLQETPEQTPWGNLSRSIQVYLQNNLVGKCWPGDRVIVVGLYKAMYSSSTKHNACFDKALIATDITILNHHQQNQLITNEELQEMKNLSKRDDLIILLRNSLYGSIYGNSSIKEALVLQLLGGQEILLENKNKIRGSLNVLLVGDPSTGKSQLLWSQMNLSPKSFNTTGWGSSGVGLTAAIVQDSFSQEKQLQAGAMVLADQGLICIDEFDKMSFEDQVAMHEAMEQQTITISKAGIHVSLNARCSVLAAANPVYSEYICSKTPSQNIGMTDALLSWFDLVFILVDLNEDKQDRLKAEKVIQNHQQISSKEVQQKDNEADFYEEIYITKYSQRNPLKKVMSRNEEQQIISYSFAKKYVSFAQQQEGVFLNKQAQDYISQKWTLIRQIEKNSPKLIKVISINIRSLESLIRMATAYAKLRLSAQVELVDAVQAMRLFLKSFYGGYENVQKNFFKDEQELLHKGRLRAKKKVEIDKQIEINCLKENKEIGFNQTSSQKIQDQLRKSVQINKKQCQYVWSILQQQKIQGEIIGKVNLNQVEQYILNTDKYQYQLNQQQI